MTTYRLFPATNGPGTAVSFGGSFLAGVVWKVTQGGMWFQGYWWWVCAAGGQSTSAQKFALWQITAGNAGHVVAGTTVTSGTLSAGWNFIPLTTPVPVSIGTAYCAATGFTGSFPDSDTSGAGTGITDSYGTGGGHSAGIVNGPLTAFSDNSGTNKEPYGCNQGLFGTAGTDPSVTMPSLQSNSANFWMDLQVSDTGPAGYPGSYRLYPNKSETNSATVPDLSVNYSVATEFHLSRPCYLSKIWYYSPAGTAQLATSARIWTVAGPDAGTSLVTSTSPSWSGAAGSGWISTAFTGTVLPAGIYKASIYNGVVSPDGWSAKDASTNYWGTGGAGVNGITWGPLTAPGLSGASAAYEFVGANGGSTPKFTNGTTEPGQCTFVNGDGDFYPYLYVDALGQNYWLDIEVIPYTYGAQAKASATARPLQRLPRGHGTGTKATAAPAAVPATVSGVQGAITVTAPAGTVTAVTGTPGRAIRARTVAKPARGQARGASTGTLAAAVTGTTGTIAAAAPAGTVTAVTGSPGRIIRRVLPAPRRGTGHGAQAGPVTQPGIVAGTAGQITIAAPAGTVTAVVTTAAPGRVIRPRPSAPRRGTGRGTFAVTAAPGVITGVTGQITVTAPAGTVTAAGTISVTVAGPPGRLTLTAIIGTVTAVTGSPGKAARSRTILPRPARRGHGQPGTAGTTLHGATGTVTVRAPAGTVTAVTGTTGKTARGRTTAPPRRGTGTGRHGTAGTAIAAPPGIVTVTGPAGAISSTVNGTPGTVAVTGPGGHVVLVPYRYVRWDIRPGFAATGPRSHLIQGSPGMVTVKAPAGTVTIS